MSMKYYRGVNGQVFAFEADGSQDSFIPEGAIAMTDAETKAYLNPPPTEEQLREKFKAERAKAVAKITVTIDGNFVFDGDEESQNRMARAILGLQASPEGSTVQWVMHDNTVVNVGIVELQKALILAGLRQTELWVQA